MAAPSSKAAIWAVNKYLLSNTTLAGLFGYTGGSDQIPFFPGNVDPEGVSPYVRYAVRTSQDPEAWWTWIEDVAYILYFKAEADSTHAFNLIVDMLSRGDESATELERWAKTNTITLAYHYHSFEFSGGNTVEAPDEEGGVRPRFLTIRYKYSPKAGTSLL